MSSTVVGNVDRQRRSRILVCVLVAATAGVVMLGAGTLEVRSAMRERNAYKHLCRLGATGDDWVGWRELILGRDYAPIVQLDLPPSIKLEVALPLLAHLDNLEALSLSCGPINDDQFSQLRELRSVRSLGFTSRAITDAAVPYLAQFTHIRWLYLRDTRITNDGIVRLQTALPNCKIKQTTSDTSHGNVLSGR